MTMLTPNDPGSGRLFFWTRQGISLQQLYDLIAEAIASGGVPGVPGAPGAPGSGISSESPIFTGTTAVTNIAVSGTVTLPDGSVSMADVSGLPALVAQVGTLTTPAQLAAAIAGVGAPLWANIIGTPGGGEIDLICPGDAIRPRSDAGNIPPGYHVNWVKKTPPPQGGPYMLDIDTYEVADV